MDGHSEIDLLTRLGVKYGTMCGGLEHLFTDAVVKDENIYGLDVPLEYPTMLHDIDEDVNPGDSNGVVDELRIVSETDLKNVTRTLWEVVQHNNKLAICALGSVKRVLHETLEFKATLDVARGTHNSPLDTASDPVVVAERFQPIPGATRGLARRKDFVEKFHPRRRKLSKQSPVMEAAKEVNVQVNVENEQSKKDLMVEIGSIFQRQRCRVRESLQSQLDREAHSQMDLNAIPLSYDSEVPSRPKRYRQTKDVIVID